MNGGVESYREWLAASKEADTPLKYEEYLRMLEAVKSASEAMGRSQEFQSSVLPASDEVPEVQGVQDPQGQEDEEGDYLEGILEPITEVAPK